MARVTYGLQPPGFEPPPASYSHAVAVGDLLFIAPQVARDATGRLQAPRDPEAQAHRIYDRLAQLLRHAGGDLNAMASAVIYAVGRESLEAVHRVQAALEARGTVRRWPATTVVLVDSLDVPEALVQVEGTGVTGASTRDLHFYPPPAIERLRTRSSNAVRCGELVWVAAQQAYTPQGAILGPGDPAMQIRQVYRRVEQVLRDLGGDLNAMVRTMTYVVGRDSMTARDRYRRELSDAGVQRNLPASTSALVAGLEDPDALVQMEAVAVIGTGPQGQRPQYGINPATMGPPSVILSHAVRYRNLAWIAGQWSRNIGTGNAEQETRAVYDFTQQVLRELGGSLDSFVKQTTYVTGIENVPASNRVRHELVREGKITRHPAGTVFVVRGVGPPQSLIEIDGVVAVD